MLKLKKVQILGFKSFCDRTEVQLAGEGDLSVNATVRIHLENVALPRVRPSQLLVSDYPERLTADGVLFTATLDTGSAQRFLYYHYNPPTEPARRVLLKVTNTGAAPAQLHVIESLAGPGSSRFRVLLWRALVASHLRAR